MPLRLFAAVAVLGLSACAGARGPELILPDLSHLKSQATETVDIDVGRFGLAIAGWMMDDDDPDTAAIRNTLKACKAVHIRSYEFGSDFEYPEAEVDAIQSQLSGDGWSQLVTVRDRKDRQNVDVYIALDRRKITGLVVLASGPRELTIVNVVGALDIEQVEKLRTHFSAQSRRHSVFGEAPPRS